MKTTHTPGPWRAGDAGYTVFGHNNGNPSPEIIANVGRGAFPNERTKANARLIAAAPDLLAALSECITEDGANCLAYGTDTPKLRARLETINALARAAIAKAKG